MNGATKDGTSVQERLVIMFADADYCFGSGPLRLRIEHIDWHSPILYDGELWYDVEGFEVDPEGVPGLPRRVSVRGRRLPAPPRPTSKS